jgi:Flp pilus assembly protein TadD
MSTSLNPKFYTKYQSLVAERNRLRAIMTKYKYMSNSPNFKSIRAQYVLRVKQIKELYKTHA